MSPSADFAKIVRKVRKHVPDAIVEMTDQRLPRWKLANRAAWLEYDSDGDLLVSGTKGGGSTLTRKHKRKDTASDTAATVTEFLVEPVEPVEQGAERPS